MKEFKEPDFTSGNIELRFEEDEICIYATKEGLEKIITFCKSLIGKPRQGHIHLEDSYVLTKDSLKGVIAIFPSREGIGSNLYS